MEIKSAEEEKDQYPKSHEINNKQIKRCIPIKWLKLGITTAIFEIIMKSKVNAIESMNRVIVPKEFFTSGDVKAVAMQFMGCDIPIIVMVMTNMVAIVMFIINTIVLIVTKNEQSKITKLRGRFESSLVSSIVIFIIFPILSIVTNITLEWLSVTIALVIIFIIIIIGSLILRKVNKSNNTKLKVFLVILILSIEVLTLCRLINISAY